MIKKIMQLWITYHKKILVFGVPALAIIIIIILIINLTGQGSTQSTFRETSVYYGDLTVGVTEDGAVSIGTTDQTFDLDISAFVASGSSSSTSQNLWGQDMMNSMNFQIAALSTNVTRELVVESVYTAVGEQIQEGEAILKFTDDSVDSIRDELQTDVTEAQLTLEQLKTSQRASRLSAEQNYETNISYGKIAQSEYSNTINSLNSAVSDAESQLSSAQADLVNAQTELETITTEYDNSRITYQEYLYQVSTIDFESNYWYYIVNDNYLDKAETMMNELYDEYTSLIDEIENLETLIETYSENLNTAKYNLKVGTIKAQAEYDSRVLSSQYGSESYEVALAYLERDLADAQTDYDEAYAKLDEFDSYIVNGELLSDYTGIITSIDVESEDAVTTSTNIASMYNWDDVTIDVTVDEDDMESITVGSEANLDFDAYPDQLFTGTVTEISDASTDSSTGDVTYTVTVTIDGDVSGIYEGMTGNVTFITKEVREVLYVSNRAIIREGTKSYVKIYDANGKIVEKQVKTGFSDGINVEITEGLEEGDTVLIESMVSES